MEKTQFDIDGPILIFPVRFSDNRGYFCETFKKNWFQENIADVEFVQINQSFSQNAGTVRGLHFQDPPMGQGKLVSCVNGEIIDFAVDIRANSPTYGKYIKANLSSQNGHQLWIPEGFAHGFCTMSDDCIISYQVTQYYSKQHDNGIAFNDKDISIEWPFSAEEMTLSQKDIIAQSLMEYGTYNV